jgi:hypothetical protein
LAELKPAAAKIRSLADLNYQLLFSCVVYCSERPTLYFDRRVVASLKDLGADFDIDVYFLPEG